jgi:hypothetical protein
VKIASRRSQNGTEITKQEKREEAMTLEKIRNLRARFCEIHGINDDLWLATKDAEAISSMEQAERLTEFLIQSLARGNWTHEEEATLATIRIKLDEFVEREATKMAERDGKFYTAQTEA